MANKRIAMKKGDPRKAFVRITEQVGINILNEVYEKGYSVARISATYDVSKRAVYNFLKRTPYTPKLKKQFNPDEVLKRAELDPLPRLKLLTNSAAQVVELTLAFIQSKLEAGIDGTADIKIADLTQFFKESAPYVLSKKDTVTKKVEHKDTPKGKLHEMFKTQMTKIV
jgi:hypothetical protein